MPIDIGSQTPKVMAKSGCATEVNVFSSDCKVSEASFWSLASSFCQLADARLTDTQKQVLVVSYRLLQHRDLSMTALANLVSRKESVPYSTVKWNLRSLRDMGLMRGGDASSKGTPAELTAEAHMLADLFEKQV
jgi:hypothetical protein